MNQTAAVGFPIDKTIHEEPIEHTPAHSDLFSSETFDVNASNSSSDFVESSSEETSLITDSEEFSSCSSASYSSHARAKKR